ncbi:DNA recombination and repair protein RecF [hydrothermal vent metagenome]|uniref:DNA replication and repair protein RecF n=1 Tax=hydrothermal vent metagenome TaxID=652676 RepID=A0A1W1CRM5_9ZZZZ
MSVIKELYIGSYRNIHKQQITLSDNFNIFIGNNGNGKTNFIESIYYIAHNKSYKTKNLESIIPHTSKQLSLAIKTTIDTIKLQKTKNKTNIAINSTYSKNTSNLTKKLPIQIISADRGYITSATSKIKRQFLNWGLFHVEPNFVNLYKKYNKTLIQINKILLHNEQQSLNIWLKKWVDLTIKINILKKTYIKEHIKLLDNFKKKSKKLKDFEFELVYGIPKTINQFDAQELLDFITQQIPNLIKKKYLIYGPHRSSILFKYKKKPIEIYSRGEQKTFSIVFLLLQVLYLKKKDIKPIILIDDISSELDDRKVGLILSFLEYLDCQTFITNIYNIKKIPKDSFVFKIKKGVIVREK